MNAKYQDKNQSYEEFKMSTAAAAFNQEANIAELDGQETKLIIFNAVAHSSRKRVEMIVNLATGATQYVTAYGNSKGEGHLTFDNLKEAVAAYNRFKIV